MRPAICPRNRHHEISNIFRIAIALVDGKAKQNLELMGRRAYAEVVNAADRARGKYIEVRRTRHQVKVEHAKWRWKHEGSGWARDLISKPLTPFSTSRKPIDRNFNEHRNYASIFIL
jgi:hypothetical protein